MDSFNKGVVKMDKKQQSSNHPQDANKNPNRITNNRRRKKSGCGCGRKRKQA